MSADIRLITAITDLAAAGFDIPGIAEETRQPMQRVRNIVAQYAIRIRRPMVLNMPSAPVKKLMGGR